MNGFLRGEDMSFKGERKGQCMGKHQEGHTQREETHKDAVTRADVERFVENNKIFLRTWRTGRKCIDGRHTKEQASDFIARPGGDLGYVMALLGVSGKNGWGLSAADCFTIVKRALANLDEKFYCHSDTHVQGHGHHDDSKIGCGHAAKASYVEHADDYGVDAHEMQSLIELVNQEAASEESDVEMVVLQGDHAERGVIIINDMGWTVAPYDEETDEMYFVYDKMRDEEFMKLLWEQMLDDASLPDGADFDDFKAVSDQQMGKTMELLAKEKPVFSVEFHRSGQALVQEA